MFEAMRRRRRGPSGQPAQPRAGGRQLVGVGLGRLLAVQQRVGDLVDPVVVPAGHVAVRPQHGAVVAAQGGAVDDDDLDPVQPAQGPGVEDQLPGVGQAAAQHRGERLTAHVCGAGHPGQQGAGRVLGAPAGQQRGCRGDQRRVGGLVGVLLHGPGHRPLGGVDGGVDGSADHDV